MELVDMYRAHQRLHLVSVAAHVPAALQQRQANMAPFTAAILQHARVVSLRLVLITTDSP